MKDLRNDPLVRRGQRVTVAMEQAVDYGTQKHGDDFFLNVKPKEQSAAAANGNGAAAPNTLSTNGTHSSEAVHIANGSAVPAQPTGENPAVSTAESAHSDSPVRVEKR